MPFGIEYGRGDRKAYRFFALETDRGTMPVARTDRRQTSYFGKLIAYREMIEKRLYKVHWGVPNLLVLTVTIGRDRAAEMMRVFETQPGNTDLFLFKAVRPSDLMVPAPQILFDPWTRAGLASLQLTDDG